MARSFLHHLMNVRSTKGKGSCQAGPGRGLSEGRPQRGRRRAFRPGVEALEERTTPSVVAFAPRQTFAAGFPASTAIALGRADVNGDGKPDLLAAAGNTLSVLLDATPAGS